MRKGKTTKNLNPSSRGNIMFNYLASANRKIAQIKLERDLKINQVQLEGARKKLALKEIELKLESTNDPKEIDDLLKEALAEIDN
jgi:hypothetical protein